MLHEPRLGWWLFMAGILVLQLVVMVRIRYEHMRTGYAVNAALSRQRELQVQQDRLKIEIARLKSAERLARIAKTQLNLVSPDPAQMVVLP